MKIKKVMNNIFEKCDICFEGNLISKEKLIIAYRDFLSKTIDKENHNIGIVYHTGSICFDVVAVVFASIINLITNETDTEDVISNLKIGDKVLFDNKIRCVFDGIIEDGAKYFNNKDYVGKYIKLKHDGGTDYYSESKWRLITPYNGKSSRLDGRGIKKKKTAREDFFTDVLGFSEQDIPSVIDTSSLIVANKERINSLVKGISFSFDGKSLSLLELVTSAYYMGEDWYDFGGNISKNEATLKFASRISVAREQLYNQDGNKNIGLFILGDDSIARGETEIPALLSKKSLKYVYICTNLDSEYGDVLIQDNEDINIFACTKDFLLDKHYTYMIDYNDVTQELCRQIYLITRKQIKSEIMPSSPITWGEYKNFKKRVLAIKRNDTIGENKDNFIIQAHSLMNLFLSSVFPIKFVDEYSENGLIEIDSPKAKIELLGQYANEMSADVKDKALRCVADLNDMYIALYDNTEKQKWLIHYLREKQNNKVAVVVPKAYYITLMKETFGFSSHVWNNITIVTANRFDNSVVYDSIVVIGNITGKKFDVFRCNASEDFITLIYDFERKTFEYNRRKADDKLRTLSSKSTIKIHNFNPEIIDEKEKKNDLYAEEIEIGNEEIESYISSLDSVIDVKNVSRYLPSGGNYNAMAETVAVAVFSDGSKAFFTRKYKAYVLDEDMGSVKESDVLDLAVGDSLIFTRRNNETRDIVDSILERRISEKKVTQEVVNAYEKSKYWKRNLFQYRQNNNLTVKELANKLTRNGKAVTEGTIRTWMDEDSHTVGPREEDTIRQIGILTGDSSLANNSNAYFEACRQIRIIRRKILDQVGHALIEKLSGKSVRGNDELDEIYNKIDDLAVVLQIERITEVNREIPAGAVNRPIYI